MGNVNNSKDKKVGVVYCRVSTEDQAHKGLSLDVQQAECTKMLQDEGYSILEVVRDEGISAKDLKRKGIQEILQYARDGKIHALCTLSRDRLARNTMHSILLHNELKKHEVDVLYVKQQNPDDSATSKMIETLLSAVDQFQLDSTGEKVKGTQRAKVKAGYYPSVPPAGYINAANPDKNADRIAQRVIIPHETNGPLITEVFKMYATGNYNAYDLNDIMFKKGLSNRNGNQLSYSRIYELLKNRFYLGEIHYSNGRFVNKEAKHKALIDETTFNTVQKILTNNNRHADRRTKHKFLLSGYVYCPEHKRRYTAEWHMHKKLAYYHCPNRGGCGKYSESTMLEQDIADKFRNLEFSDEFIESVIGKVKARFYDAKKVYSGRRQSLINKRTALEKQLQVATEKLLNNTLDDDDYSTIKIRVRQDMSNLDERIHELECTKNLDIDVVQEVLGFTRDIYKTYQHANFQYRRHLLGFFWERFEVKDKVIIKSTPSVLFSELLKFEHATYNKKQKKQIGKKTPKCLKNDSLSSSVINCNQMRRGQDSNLRYLSILSLSRRVR